MGKKNKRIDWNEQTQAYQVFSLDESIEKENREVVESTDLFMGKYGGKELMELGVPEVLIPSVLKIKKTLMTWDSWRITFLMMPLKTCFICWMVPVWMLC